MKKLLFIALILPFVFGCTLSMEEYIVPEEKLGFEEPRTIETPYGNITYQFNEGVLYVSDNVQEYLAQVDHDTILYFMSTLPSEWKPQVGSKLASGCTHKLPFGLNHRVLSVEEAGGLIKVVCTKTTRDDVYKYLSYNLDAEVACPDLSGISDDSLLQMGYERRDSIIINWNLYDQAKGLGRYASKTRDESYNETGDPESTTILDMFFDTRDIQNCKKAKGESKKLLDLFVEDVYAALKTRNKAVKENGSLSSSGSWYAGVGLTITHFSKVHSERDVEREYECNYTDTWNEYEGKIEVGYEHTVDKNRVVNREILGEKIRSFSAAGDDWVVLRTVLGGEKAFSVNHPPITLKAKNTITSGEGRLVISAAPVPVALIYGWNLDPAINIGGSISVVGSYTTAVHRIGSKTGPNGESIKIDEDVEKGHSNFKSLCLNGHAELGARFRAYAGVEVACATAVTIGANVEAGLKVEGDMGFKSDTGSASDLKWHSPSGSAQLFAKLYGDIQFHIQPLGVHLWDKELARFWETYILNATTKIEPNIYLGGYTNTDEGKYECRGYWTMKSSGLTWLLFTKSGYRPGMYIYFGPIEDGNGWLMEECEPIFEDGDDAKPPFTSLDYDKQYNFMSEGMYMDDETKEFNLQPCIYKMNENGDIIDMLALKEGDCTKLEVGSGEVKCYSYKTEQTSGQEFWGYWNTAMDGYVDPKSGLHKGTVDDTSSEDADKTNGYYYSGSYDPNSIDWREYKMTTELQVNNGSRLRKWGVTVKLYGSDKKTELLGTNGDGKKMSVNKLQSGKYRMNFKFLTNWKISSSSAKDECLYFTVRPWWNDAETNRYHRGEETEKIPIKYEMDDISDFYKNPNWQNDVVIIPEKDLDH